MDAMFFDFLSAKQRIEDAVRSNVEASEKIIEALSVHGSKLKKLRVKPKKSLQ